MKYQVQISYTNFAHEHISLRRRVDTVTRIVEARTEQEALNRAANQQRALGFMIKEAKVVKPAVLSEKIEQIDEATHFLYTGTVNGNKYELTIPRHNDISDFSDEQLHEILSNENPHLKPHEVTAIVNSGGEYKSKVNVEHKGKKYTHHVINHQEPRRIYNENFVKDKPKRKPHPGEKYTVPKKPKFPSEFSSPTPIKPLPTKNPYFEEVEQIDELNLRRAAKTALAVGALAVGAVGGHHNIKSTPTPDDVNRAMQQVHGSAESDRAHELSQSRNAGERNIGSGALASLHAKKRGEVAKKLSRSAHTGVNLFKDIVSGQNLVVPGAGRGNFKNVNVTVNGRKINEGLTASDPVSKWISKFVNSDDPKFAGKSKKERIKMALAAYYAATRGN